MDDGNIEDYENRDRGHTNMRCGKHMSESWINETEMVRTFTENDRQHGKIKTEVGRCYKKLRRQKHKTEEL